MNNSDIHGTIIEDGVSVQEKYAEVTIMLPRGAKAKEDKFLKVKLVGQGAMSSAPHLRDGLECIFSGCELGSRKAGFNDVVCFRPVIYPYRG